MSQKGSVIDLLAIGAKSRSRSSHFPRLHPTFPTTASCNRLFPRPRTVSSKHDRVLAVGRNSQTRLLRTAARPSPPPPPSTRPQQAQPPSPSATHTNPVDPDLAASEAERIAFSSLAFTTSITNSGSPIYLSDLDSPPPIVDDARAEPPYLFTPLDAQLDFPTWAFTTSIANTGNPFEDLDVNTVDPTLRREWTTPPVIEEASSPAHRNLIHPDFPVRSPTKSTQPSPTSSTMSDTDYAAFLEKQSGSDVNTTSSSNKQEFTATTSNTEVPSALQKIDTTYQSESDEAFEPVSLKLDGADAAGQGRISIDTFRGLTQHTHAEGVQLKAFDPRAEYAGVVDTVKKEGNGEAQVFKVPLKGARLEYWVVSLDAKGKRMVGVKVGSVES